MRGRQSAALVVVSAEGEPWHAGRAAGRRRATDPLAELRQLLDLADAYEVAKLRADELAGEGRHEGRRALRAGGRRGAGNVELSFWAGLGIAAAGDLDRGAERVRAALDAYPGWRDLLARLDPEIAPAVDAVREALGVERERPGAVVCGHARDGAEPV